MTPAQRAEAERLISEGASHREVARTVGLDRGLVSRTWPGTGWSYTEAGAFARAVRAAKEEAQRRGVF